MRPSRRAWPHHPHPNPPPSRGRDFVRLRPPACEGVVLDALAARGGSLAVVETFTAGQIAARIAHLPGTEKVFRRGLVARDPRSRRWTDLRRTEPRGGGSG